MVVVGASSLIDYLKKFTSFETFCFNMPYNIVNKFFDKTDHRTPIGEFAVSV